MDKYKYLTDDEIVPLNKIQIIGEAQFAFLP